VEKEISFPEAVLGTTIEVPTLEGKKRVKVPPGTQSHTKMRLKGLGMPRFQKEGRGDEFVKVLVRVPKKMTEKGVSGAPVVDDDGRLVASSARLTYSST
jgi:DnaJ-class molecular chaperone